PVKVGDRLVGIITESDILHAFIEMMGLLSGSARIDVKIGDNPGDLNHAIQIIHDHGGDIINVAMTDQATRNRTYYFRLTQCNTHPIQKALEAAGFVVQAVMQ
ncbi:MAG: hypothetical protein PVI60_13600, partial [Desulfobacteraceae bacterium]